MRGEGKLRHKVFWMYFASQSSLKKRMSLFGLGDFFGAHPKKLPPFLLDRSALLRRPGPPHPRPLFRKARGVKDLEEAAAKAQLHLSPRNRPPSADFFWVDPKKVPLF
jgi:hypothetical protein